MLDDRSVRQTQRWLDDGPTAETLPGSFFRAYVDNMVESLVWFDADFRILYCNASFLRDFDLSPEDAAGTYILDLLSGSAREEMLERLSEAANLTVDRPTRVEDFAGQRVWLSSVYTGQFNSEGHLVAISDQARDHSEKHKAHRELEESNRQLEESNRRLEESNRDLQDFAYIASHDLSEPLRKISSFGDRLATKYSDSLDDRGLDYLARMQSAANRMQTLIDDVLTFSRIATHGTPLELAEVREIVDDVLIDLEVGITEADARIIIHDLPTLAVDRSQLRQLFQNLVANALKFRSPGRRLEIEIAATLDSVPRAIGLDSGARAWKISVTDNGIGFDEKYREKIFTVFQRLHSRAAYPGSGVGLAMCRRIAERHGGALVASSEPGVGSTFIFWLPLHAADMPR